VKSWLRAYGMGEHEEQEQGEEQSCELGHVGREG